ncbi:MAG: STAS domain-containing protein [Firmicutes bacterium]|nr:STAS domain-containing protein [Bacillota bacterium]
MDLEYNKGILFVRLDGYLNRNTTYKINNYLVPVLIKHKIKYLVYNFYNLYDIDEDGLDAILNTKYAIKTNRGLIYLCEVNELVNKKIHKLHIRKTENELSAFHVIEV